MKTSNCSHEIVDAFFARFTIRQPITRQCRIIWIRAKIAVHTLPSRLLRKNSGTRLQPYCKHLSSTRRAEQNTPPDHWQPCL